MVLYAHWSTSTYCAFIRLSSPYGIVHCLKSVRYLVEPQTGELAEDVQESDMFDPLTPDMDQDDSVDKLYGNLSDGEIQVRYHKFCTYARKI